jgi:hypothetical protein
VMVMTVAMSVGMAMTVIVTATVLVAVRLLVVSRILVAARVPVASGAPCALRGRGARRRAVIVAGERAGRDGDLAGGDDRLSAIHQQVERWREEADRLGAVVGAGCRIGGVSERAGELEDVPAIVTTVIVFRHHRSQESAYDRGSSS